jgi:ElaB/YqjD/DUF883 family membrane-anchored ribosome-binding protein
MIAKQTDPFSPSILKGHAMGSDNMTEQLDLSKLGTELKQVKEEVTRLAGAWADRGEQVVEETGKDVMAYAKNTAMKAQKFVQERPVTTAIVGASVLGLIVGSYMLCNRK